MVAEPQHATYPIQLLVNTRPALVVGAGNVALRKTRSLVAAGAEVTVVAPVVHRSFGELAVKVIERSYQLGDLDGFQIVLTCTNNPAVNRDVFNHAEAAGIWVNSADDPINCSFILPAVARQGDLTVSVSTNGKSPALASWLRKKLEQDLDSSYAALLELLTEVRAEARYLLGTSEVKGWNDALDDGLLELLKDGRTDDARQKLHSHLGLGSPARVEASA